jgi:NADPH:quinone reductase-like Zn-dependent oxidoreductase
MHNRRAVITKRGGPEVLAVIEEELPPPERDEVQLRVLASGVAYGDVMKRMGLNPGMPKLPYTPGYDLVGEVIATGPDVRRFKVGDRVAGFVLNGANTEYANFPEGLFVPLPPRIDPVDALCLVLNYVTAEQMLHRKARIQPGQRILVHGAAGGVGTALLQLGRLDRLEMYGTASIGKHDIVRGLGATPIDYKSEDFVKRVRDLTGNGVDAAFDPIGGAHLGKSHRVVKKGGTLVAYGISCAAKEGTPAMLSTFLRLGLYKLVPDGKACCFYGIQDQKTIQEDLEKLLALLRDGQIAPVVAAKLPLTRIVEAHALMDTAGVAGKIVLLPESSLPRS